MQELVISESRKIVVQKKEWQNRMSLDIRSYVTSDNYSGYTKKGINIPVKKVQELIDAIKKEMEEQKSE